MKFKIIITILLGILISNFSFANFYQKGDTLNVWAVSGLNMREGPGTDFHKIQKLQYGDQIVVTDNYLQSSPLSLTVVKKNKKSDGFVLKGFWVRVKIGEQEGYVFDGYLSRLKTPKIKIYQNKKDQLRYDPEYIDNYVKRVFIIEKTEKSNPSIEHFINKYFFKNDILLFNEGSNACGGSGLILPKYSLNEIYLLFNILFEFEESLDYNKDEKYDKGDQSIQIKQTKNKLEIILTDSMCSFRFIYEKNKGSIGLDCCC